MIKHSRIMSIRRITGVFVISFVLFGAVMRQANVVQAAAVSPNNIISYEGRLLNASGAPVADASLNMIFRLYDAVSGGTCLWSNSSATCASATARSVTLTDGLFSENLGDTGASYAAIQDTVFLTNAAVYLQVDIGGETLVPRKLFTASPYALNAGGIDGLDSTAFLQATGDVASGNFSFEAAVFNGGSPMVFEGTTADVFRTTFSFTDPTADRTVTFQNATGTVALMSDVTAAASKWTDAGAITYLTATTDNLAVGGTGLSGSALSVSASTNTTTIGSGAGTNGTLVFNASDGDTGNLAYATDDTLHLYGGDLSLDQNLFISGGAMTLATLTPTFILANTGTLNFTDGVNSLMMIADAGTTGNVTVTGALQVSGNVIDGNTGALAIGSGGSTTYVKIGADTPSFVSGAGDLFVSDDLEVKDQLNGVAGIFSGAVSASDFTCTDCLDFTELSDSMALDSSTTISSSSGQDFTINVGTSGASGNFLISNNLGTFVDFSNDESTTFTPDTVSGTAFSLTGSSLTTGTLMSLGSSALNSGTLLSLNGNSAALTSGDLLHADYTPTYNSTRTSSGNMADFQRSLTAASGAALTVSGALMQLSSNMSITSGSVADSSNVLSLSQLYASATGAVEDISSLAVAAPILKLSGPNFTDDTGMALFIDVTEVTSTADIFKIQSDFSTANNDVFRVEANGGIYSDSGLAVGTSTNTKYSDNSISSTGGPFFYQATTSFTWTDDALNSLMVLSDGGTVGNLELTGDLTVDGDDVQSNGAALRLNGTAGYPVYVGASSATVATGPGDLFVSDNLEVAGSSQFGTASTAVTWSFASIEDAQPVFSLNIARIATEAGMLIQRPDAGADFDGTATRGLVAIEQLKSSAGTDGEVLTVQNFGGGNSTALYVTQNGVDAPASGSVGQQALIIDVNEAAADVGSDEDVMIIRSDADGGTPDTEFRFQLDGDALADGSFTGGGADFAEFFLTRDTTLGNNDVACRSLTIANAVERCAAGNHDVVGVISTNPSFIGNNIPGAERDLRGDSNYRVVGMLGQIDTKVTAADGAIAVGDPVTTSSTTAGYAGKAHGPVQIIGRALEPLASGTGMIKVHVTPSWYAGDVFSDDSTTTLVSDDLALAAVTTATANTTVSNSHVLAFRGSAWSGSAATTRQMVMLADVSSADVYGISVRNNVGDQVAHISQSGDLALAGKLYPSDRGQLQTDKYIYFDSSTADGYMRTNAAGWATGSYDFAEMFPSSQSLAAGEVVTFASDNSHVQRSTGTTYDAKIAGVISTRPGFLAGEGAEGNVPVALSGRVPTYVSGENGAISVGDPLTTSTHAGYAMKATEPGPIVGYAMEPFTGNTGVITAVVRPSYYEGDPVTDAPEAENTASQLMTVSDLDVTGSLNMNGGRILSISSLAGLGNTWRLDENGDFVTTGRIATEIRSTQGENVSTYAVTSTDTLLQLSGTATLMAGTSLVDFETVDPHFNDVIAEGAVYRVFLTPSAPTGQLYAVNRTNQGFEIREANGFTDGVTVDWMVMAYRKDFAPDSAMFVTPPEVPPVVDEPVVDAPEETPTGDTSAEDDGANTTDTSDTTNSEDPAPVDDAFVPPPAGEEVVPTPDVPADETPEPTADPAPEVVPEVAP